MKILGPKTRQVLCLWIAATLLMMPGCATLVSGDRQNIRFTSTPQGAQIAIDSVPSGVTPTMIPVGTENDHSYTLTLDGYEPAFGVLTRDYNGYVLGNILLGGGIGLIVDLISGAAWELTPEFVHAQLVPIDETQDGA